MKLIVLDRDGVINYDSPNYIRSPDEFHPIASSLTAIRDLTEAAYTIVVCTNQSGLGRGYFDRYTLNAIHDKMMDLVHQAGGDIQQIYHCPHRPEAQCACRKPGVGMLMQVAKDFHVDLQDKFMIGDKMSDIEAARAMSMQGILIQDEFDDTIEKVHGVMTMPNLYAASRYILGQG